MEVSKNETVWETTNVTNLLRNRQSKTYYARVKVNGKQKWRGLKTMVFSVAKLKLADVEKTLRGQAHTSKSEGEPTRNSETSVGRFIALIEERIQNDPTLAPGTKERRHTAIKALKKTWPDLAQRDARRLTRADCQTWGAKALREGTGFIAPNVKTIRKGMSASAFNKCVDALRAILEIAREEGVIFENPAKDIAKASLKQKRLELPSGEQFQVIAKSIAGAGARWSLDCADLVRLLAYSGLRLREATSLEWRHYNTAKNQLTVAGTKTETSYRIVPVIVELATLLSEIRARRGHELETAPIVNVGGCLGALKTACKSLGISPLTHHDLRHLFATRCIESGVDIPTVSRWLGHSDGGALAMKTYGHLRQDHSQAQAAKVSFGGGL
jgi:integrase